MDCLEVLCNVLQLEGLAVANLEGQVACRAEDRELRKAKIAMADENMQDKNRQLLERNMFLLLSGF